jgi:hypothetical protein
LPFDIQGLKWLILPQNQLCVQVSANSDALAATGVDEDAQPPRTGEDQMPSIIAMRPALVA